MEAFQHRRKAVTYGKSRKKLHLDSIFDHEIVSGASIRLDNWSKQEQQEQQEHVKDPTTKKRTPDGITIQGQQAAPKPHGQPSRLESPLKTDHSQDLSDSSRSQSSHQNGSASSSILDILDSDEEACAQQLQPLEVKRRKVTSLSSRPSSIKDGRVQKRDRAPVTVVRDSRKHRNEAPSQKRRMSLRQVKEITKVNVSSQLLASRPSTKNGVKPIGGLSKISQNNQGSSSNKTSLAPTAFPADAFEMQQKEDFGQDELRETVQQSPPETPKARRTLQRRIQLSRPVASPSQLGLTSLRLAPDKKRSSRTASPENVDLTPRRARHRLTDRLDAPEEDVRLKSASPGLDGDVSMEAGGNSSAKQTLVPQTRLPTAAASAGVPASSGTVRAVNERSRLTYAKERSHLSDMVDETGDLKALQPLRLAPSMPTDPSGRLSQDKAATNDIEDSDEVAAATAVKSIHELRQAGINNRFERDMETLFEDIEPLTGPSKASRIQALLQLIQKLNQPKLARQFVEIGMTRRLADCVQADVDTVSAMLLMHTLSRLLHVDHMSTQHVLAAFHAIVSLSPSLLMHNKPFKKFVADRKQNLSKALSRELAQFGNSTQIGPVPGTIPWTPHHVALFALEQSLRIIRTLKAVPACFPAALFNQILFLLSTLCDDEVSSDTQPHVVIAALSILEFSAIYRVSLEHEENGNTTLNYGILADVVTRLLTNKTFEDADLRSSGLRLVVSLTNNDPGVCTALAATGLIPAVFVVIQQEFPRLSDNADRGDEFDNSKLNSVIMALGCLLNLADCSSEARKRMYAPSVRNSSSVQWLVSVFNQRAGKAEEATTIAQGQVLVAFNYMSMLLCTLCLDDDIYESVASSVQGKGVTALCVEGKEFLDKLEKLASLNPEDPNTSTFNARFKSILVNLSTRMSS